MRKTIIITAATALVGTATIAQARTSSDVEFRGYNNCVEAAENASNGLVPARNYYVNRDGADATYYINATRWEDGARAPVRISCETTTRGAQLVSKVIEDGRFTNQSSTVRVEVASN